VFAPQVLARVYTTDPAVVAAAVPIFLICACNQLLDGSQVVLTGALRGMGETRVPFLANFGCSWLWGVPISALLVWHWHLGLVGVWLGESFAVVPIFLIVVVTWLRRVRTTQRGLRRRRQERTRALETPLEGFGGPLPVGTR
jgi:multidrug resistance protein, MATE family